MITELDRIGHYGFRYRIISSNLPLEEQKKQANTMPYNALFFMLEGEMKISWGKFCDITIKAGELFFLPHGANVSACIISRRVEYIAIRLMHDLDNTPALIDLLKSSGGGDDHEHRTFPSLPINDVMGMFVDSIKRYSIDGIDTPQLYNVKLMELYTIFVNYYTRQDCANLLHPILKKNLKFRTFILDNYSVAITIEELVGRSHMSRSTFDRKFKETFSMTPHKWLETQTRMRIINKASEPNVTVKDMMYEVGLSNPSQFTQLCKRLLGKSPSQLIKHK